MFRFVCYFSAYPENTLVIYAAGRKDALRKFAKQKGYKWITTDMVAKKNRTSLTYKPKQ